VILGSPMNGTERAQIWDPFPHTAIIQPELNIAANSRKETYVRVRILHNEISNDELERGEALIYALYEK
jgi:hypothetical protein